LVGRIPDTLGHHPSLVDIRGSNFEENFKTSRQKGGRLSYAAGDPTTHNNSLPVSRAILVASTMAGYPINIENVMSRVIKRVVNEVYRSYPFPNFLTMYFEDQDGEKRKFDVKVKPKMPFSWYSLKGDDNPKTKR